MEKLKLIELFSGIGAQVRGLQNTGLFDVEVVATSEIDKDAMLSYAVIHCGLTDEVIDRFKRLNKLDLQSGELWDKMADYLARLNIGYDFLKNKKYDWQKYASSKNDCLIKYYLACKLSNNMGDISKIDSLPYADLITYSYPCVDLSISGRQQGLIKGETRSGLLYEATRLFQKMIDDGIPPKYLLMENVKNLVSKKFKPQFDEILQFLDDLGYNTYYQVLNASECGIPQNRERVFALSIRKDVDKGFTFPQPFDTGIRLNDVVDAVVDPNYDYPDWKAVELVESLKQQDKLDGYPIIGQSENTYKNYGVICGVQND